MTPSGPPSQPPIGLEVARTAKLLNRAFDDALAEAGGSLPAWLILLALKSRRWRAQRELAEAVGVEGATLTHHLAALERRGLVSRERDPANRRAHRVELTEAGDEAFHRLRSVAVAFDARLREDLSDEDLAHLRGALERLRANASPGY